MTGERLLIVNADDFGLTRGVDRAILRCAADGIVTSTSVLATGPTLAESHAALRDSGIGIGAHLTAVGGGAPLLSTREVPTLVDASGRLPETWQGFLHRSLRRQVDPAELAREFAAQIEALRALDLRIGHLDTHQNIHLWPSVATVVLDLAASFDIGFVRVPRSRGRSPRGIGVRRLSGRLARRVRAAGLPTTAATVGLDEAGALHEPVLHDAIARLGGAEVPVADIVCHPGEAGDVELAATGWGFAWADEVAALVAPSTRAAVDAAGFRLGRYDELRRPDARADPPPSR